MNVMTNKTQNRFRDLNSKKRLSAKEAMKHYQQRKSVITSTSGLKDYVKIGLFALMQVAYIYSSYYMEDRSNILDNVE